MDQIYLIRLDSVSGYQPYTILQIPPGNVTATKNAITAEHSGYIEFSFINDTLQIDSAILGGIKPILDKYLFEFLVPTVLSIITETVGVDTENIPTNIVGIFHQFCSKTFPINDKIDFNEIYLRLFGTLNDQEFVSEFANEVIRPIKVLPEELVHPICARCGKQGEYTTTFSNKERIACVDCYRKFISKNQSLSHDIWSAKKL